MSLVRVTSATSEQTDNNDNNNESISTAQNKRGQQTWYHSTCYIYTVFQKNPCDYVFDDNLNSKRPILLIFGTVIT